MSGVLLLVPHETIDPRRPDEHFAREAAAARARGIDVALIDHDALVQSGDAARAVERVHIASDDAVYRGWMVGATQYAALADALRTRGVHLRTSPDHYRDAHELPGWYERFADLTPTSAWFDADADVVARGALDAIGPGPAVVKDHVKSMKHKWDEAAFVPDTASVDAVRTVVARFLELRGDDLVGGVVLRRFEQFEPGEARTWWVDGECRLVTPHPDTPDLVRTPELPDGIDVALRALGLRFVTVDLARTTDGTWRVVEVGDGQVSDLPSTTDPDALLDALTPVRPPP
jgi:hypothetical protein